MLKIIFAAILLVVLNACSADSRTTPNSEIYFPPAVSAPLFNTTNTGVYFMEGHAFWLPVTSIEALKSQADHIFVGVVKDINFKILDATTGLPYTEHTEYRHRWLYTIYTVDVLVAYQGAGEQTKYIMIDGGIQGYREEEQLEIVLSANAHYNEYSSTNSLRVWSDLSPMFVGEVLLFSVVQLDENIPSVLLHNTLSLIDLDNPFEDLADIRATTNERRDELSAYSIISTFGAEAWETHWRRWQRDRPDWDERLEQGNRRSQVVVNQNGW